MPTYEYECAKCGTTFEKFQSMSDAPVKTCPECKSRRVRRLLGTGAGLLFKGSGFYQTDYRSDSYKQAAKADQSKGSKKDSSSKKESDGKKAKPSTKAKTS